ncbi:MAG: hypothetical protein K0Q95_547 [Bacteroidota bacterium]|jgi:hypothetical protein|nr:hypothetical protein [Bacteroidota bacterium]
MLKLCQRLPEELGIMLEMNRGQRIAAFDEDDQCLKSTNCFYPALSKTHNS